MECILPSHLFAFLNGVTRITILMVQFWSEDFDFNYMNMWINMQLAQKNLERYLTGNYRCSAVEAWFHSPILRKIAPGGCYSLVVQRFVSSIGNIEKAMRIFNCLGRSGHFWQYWNCRAKAKVCYFWACFFQLFMSKK